MKRTCRTHRPTADVFNPRCQRCGRPLLDQNITRDELLVRVAAIDPGTAYELTGRQRGTWVEVAQEDTSDVWMFWARPASNVAGFEAVEHSSSDPTGKELSLAFIAEMLSRSAEPAMPARHRAPRSYHLARLRAVLQDEDLACWVVIVGGTTAGLALLGVNGAYRVAQAIWSLVF